MEGWRAWALAVAVVVVSVGLERPASAHPLGFGSLELRLSGMAVEGELVIDASPVEEGAQQERGPTLLARVHEGLSLTFDGQPVELKATVLSFGQGPSAVDILRLRGAASPPQALRVVVGPAVGTLAVTLRADSFAGARSGMVHPQLPFGATLSDTADKPRLSPRLAPSGAVSQQAEPTGADGGGLSGGGSSGRLIGLAPAWLLGLVATAIAAFFLVRRLRA